MTRRRIGSHWWPVVLRVCGDVHGVEVVGYLKRRGNLGVSTNVKVLSPLTRFGRFVLRQKLRWYRRRLAW